MQLTDKLLKNKRSYWSTMICACSVFALSTIADAKPRFLSEIKDGVVEAEYNHDKTFSFSREENDKLIKRILEKLPMAQGASIVATSPKVKDSFYENETYHYSSWNEKRVHTVAVNFARADLVPTMHFQVTEKWKVCEGSVQHCQQELELGISGPSRTVRDLNDFGAFPKSLHVLKADIKFTNNTSSFGADSYASKVEWEFNTPAIQNGVEDYLRYFRTKANAEQDRMTMTNLKHSMALWAAQVSKTAFSNL